VQLIDPPISEDESKVPDSISTRFANGAATRSTIQRTIIEDQQRSRMRALVKGLVDGNPPYSESKRIANKLQWTANLNFLQGQAMMDSTAVPYYSIFNGVENYAECRTAYQPDNPQYEYWNTRISLRNHQLWRRWQQFDWHIQQISYWMRLHGIGPVFWEDDTDWRFRSMDTGCLLAPQLSPSVIDKRIPFLILRVQYRVHELFAKIEDEKAAADVGWNVEYVKNAIRYACKGLNPNAQWWASPWEWYQRQLKNNDLYTSFSTADIIFCSYAFVLEANGKITKTLSVEGGVPQAGTAIADADYKDKDYLLCQPDRYENYAQCIQAFFLNANDGQWHSVRGYGTAGFKYFELSNRILCRAADGVFIKGSLVLQPGTSKNSDKLQLTQHGPVTWLPAGAELVQVQMQGATDELLAFHRVLNNQFSSNMGVNTGQPLSRTDGRGEVPTAEQIRAQVSQDATISQGQMTLFYLQLDQLYAETFRRQVEYQSDPEAHRFVQDCLADGVPLEALKNMEYVRANRASGFGSQQARKQANQELLQIIGMLPEDGRQNAVQDIVVGIMGPEKLKRYVPDHHVPDNDDWQANEENGNMEDGHAPLLAAGQSDVVHLHSHLQAGANKLAPAQQAEDTGQKMPPEELQKLYGYVQILVHHCEEHIARLQRDPTRKGLVAMFQKQIEHMVGWSGKLRGAYIRAVKDQQFAAAQDQQAGVLNALDRAKLQSVQVDNLTKASKTAAGIQTNNAKAQNSMRIAATKAAQDMLLKQQKAEQEAALANAETTE